jgi:outer membrane protein
MAEHSQETIMFDCLLRLRSSLSPNVGADVISSGSPTTHRGASRSIGSPHDGVLIAAARVVGAVMLTMGLCARSMAEQTTEQIDEVDVTSRKQTALDSEAISISSTPDAEPSVGGISAVVGLAAFDAPVYDGAKKSKVSPLPYVDIHGLFHDRVYISDIRGIGVNIVDLGSFRAGASINYGAGRKSSDSDRLRGLPDIKSSAVVSGFMTYTLKPFAFELKVGRELGSMPSTEVSLGTSFGFAPTPRWHLSIGTQLIWADSKFNQKFFGVTATEAAQATAAGNPMSAYTPGSGLSRVSITGTSIYSLTEHWGLVGRLGLSDLIGKSAKDSPLTQRTFAPSVAVGAIYKF